MQGNRAAVVRFVLGASPRSRGPGQGTSVRKAALRSFFGKGDNITKSISLERPWLVVRLSMYKAVDREETKPVGCPLLLFLDDSNEHTPTPPKPNHPKATQCELPTNNLSPPLKS